jgi:formylglycine-generating enzyme required for sulfatase activity
VSFDPYGFYYTQELADPVPTGNRAEAGDYQPLTLRHLVDTDQEGGFPPEDLFAYATRLSNACASLHERKLVHRDLKPENIVFVEGQPVITDPGLATSNKEATSTVGTEFYVPEDGASSTAHDVFSFGKVLYQMATGNPVRDYPLLDRNWLRGDPRRGMLNQLILDCCDRTASKRPTMSRVYEKLRKLRNMRPSSALSAPSNGEAILSRFSAVRQFARAGGFAIVIVAALFTIPPQRKQGSPPIGVTNGPSPEHTLPRAQIIASPEPSHPIEEEPIILAVADLGPEIEKLEALFGFGIQFQQAKPPAPSEIERQAWSGRKRLESRVPLKSEHFLALNLAPGPAQETELERVRSGDGMYIEERAMESGQKAAVATRPAVTLIGIYFDNLAREAGILSEGEYLEFERKPVDEVPESKSTGALFFAFPIVRQGYAPFWRKEFRELDGYLTSYALNTTEVFENSADMTFVSIKPGLMASRYETTVEQWEKVFLQTDGENSTELAETKSDFPNDSNHPVVDKGIAAIGDFAERLTELDRAAGKIGLHEFYRLPTDAEWSQLAGLSEDAGQSIEVKDVRAREEQSFLWGTTWPPPQGAGNFAGQEVSHHHGFGKRIYGYRDDFVWTSPVDAYKGFARQGLIGLSGNVGELVSDRYKSGKHLFYVSRGGSYADHSKESLNLGVRNALARKSHREKTLGVANS